MSVVASSHVPEPEPDEIDRLDVATLRAMSEVQLAATARARSLDASQVDTAATVLQSISEARGAASLQYAVGQTRFAFPKRVVLRASRLFTHRLVDAVNALALAGERLVRMHQGVLDEEERQVGALRAQLGFVEQSLQGSLDALADRVATGSNVGAAGIRAGTADSTLLLLAERVRRLEAAVAGLGVDPGDEAEDARTYALFERRFRGSREEIRERQLDTLRFVAPFVGSESPVLDVGCGRGEWLELLRDAGVAAYGVDLNGAMVQEALQAGVDARHENALDHLDDVEEASLQAVTAFHLVEHVPPKVLTRLVRSAYRALRPGGLLIVETPNPTNVAVGAAAFYLDPTHLRPVHPQYLSFLVEATGFADAHVHFVHPVAEPEGDVPGDLAPRLAQILEAGEWALFGPQDYLLVATKPGVSA